MLVSNLQKFLLKQLKSLSQDYHFDIKKEDLNLDIPPHEELGDYSTTVAFKIAKQINKSPLEVANLIKAQASEKKPSFIKQIEAKEPGYLNFFIEEKFLLKEFETLSRLKFKVKINNKKAPVIIEYSAPNIAKPMHIGHLRSTIIGESLSRIYEFLGFKVIRWNYLGDWGTQFGKLIAAYKLWGDKKEIEKNPIDSLLKLYQKFHEELKTKPELEELGRSEFKKLVLGDKTNLKLWQWFRKESLKDFKRIYNLLGIKFDILKGEADFEKDIQPLIKLLKHKNLIQESEGALIISLDKFNLPVALVQKSDETSLYLTRDLASLIYRLKNFHPQQILYVVGGEQELYFKQLFAIIKLLLPRLKTELVHVKFGLVLNTNKKKFSTREGKLILLEDVLKEAKEKALLIIKAKHPEWKKEKQEKMALKLALAALKFNDLKSYRTTNLIFDWDKMYDFKGASAVYLLYTYARFHKILKKAPKVKKYDFRYLNSPLEINLIKKAISFREALNKSLQELAPNILATYLLNLADSLNNYYEAVIILKEKDINRKSARLKLIEQILIILALGLKILGIETLEEI